MATLEEVLAKLKSAPQAELEAVDWDAPEAGQFAPRLLPGVYDFIFSLEDSDPFAVVEIPKASGHLHFQAAFKAETVDPKDPSKTVTVRFQRVNSYKHEKMQISGINDLVRSMGHRLSAHPEPEEYADFFQAQSQRARFRGEVGWARYCKSCDLTIRTHARKADVKWPRDKNNKPVEVVACPGCGDKGYGREEIVRYKLPAKDEVNSNGLG